MGQSSSANLEFLICNFQFLSGNQVAKATTATKDEGFPVEIASLYMWKALAAARKGVHRKMEARASKGGGPSAARQSDTNQSTYVLSKTNETKAGLDSLIR
jgi:hypothetical protein